MPEFSGEDTAYLIKRYMDIPQSLDMLGFSPVFRRLWIDFIVDRRRKDVDENDLWHYMTHLRKTGSLPRKQRAARKPKTIQANQKELFDGNSQSDQGNVPGDRRGRRPRQARRDVEHREDR